jgi:general secretion pathway protein M
VSYAVLAAGLFAAAIAGLAAPVRERMAFFSSVAAQRTTYAKSLDALARSEVVSAQFELRRAASDPTTQVFRGETAALAGADLQNQLNSLVANEGGMILTSAFRDSGIEGPLTPIAVTVRLRCSMEALLRILHGIENRSPALFVDSLTVQARHRGGRPESVDEADLDVEMDVAGLFEAQVPK